MLLDKIQEDLKSAMKDRNEKELSAVRMLVAAIKNEEISKRPKVLEEADAEAVIKREIKKLKDGIEQFRAGGREDLAAQYEEEIKILGKYLPEEAGEEEVRRIAEEKFAAAGKKDFGSVMKAVMAELKGRAGGALVSRVVKEIIEKK